MNNFEGRGIRMLFWKEESKMKDRKMESCSRIKDENEKLVAWDSKLWRVCKEYFEDMYNYGTVEQLAVHMYGFGVIL